MRTFSRRAILAATVERDEESDILVEQQMQIAVESVGITGMSDDAQAVAVLLIEAEIEAVHPGRHPRLRRMHQLGRLRGSWIEAPL